MISYPTAGLKGLEAILFDFDGTLVHLVIDFRIINARVQALAVQAGADLAKYEGLYTLEFIERVSHDLALTDRARGAEFFAAAHAAVVEEEVKAAERATLFAGVPELLTALCRAGVKVGIVTRNCRDAVETILARCPLDHDVLLTRDDVTKVKPDPEHLLAAVRGLGASPACTMMVGDHPMDVMAGKAAVAWTIGILNDGRPPDYFDEVAPDAVLRCVVDIPAYLAEHPLPDSAGECSARRSRS